jgi:transcriptional regulator with XRE-family HTH domain
MKQIGSNIAEIRNLRRMSQDDLGKKIGKSRVVISHYERGYSDVALSVLEKIAKALGVKLEELLLGADYKKIVDQANEDLGKFKPKTLPATDARLEIIEKKLDAILDLVRSLKE